jgi:hypothetical protein
MIGAGLRVVSDSRIYYCIIDQNSTGLNYSDISHIQVPMALDRPERLNFVRNTWLDILNLYSVNRAVIRISEFSGFALNHTGYERLYLEGVLQECLAGSGVEKFIATQISQLESAGQFERKSWKKFADGTNTFEHIPPEIDWSKLKLEERESILAAYISIHL